MSHNRKAEGVEILEARRLLSGVPMPDHVVIVIEENQSYNEVIGNSSAPYINSLARRGALFTKSFAIGHPSQPNYLALFSGSTQGVTDDNLCGPFPGPDLASALAAAGRSFGGYSEDLPSIGSTVETSGNYARKHNPWVDFSDVPASENMPFTSFPSNYASLPTVSIVVPNLINDMHDGTINQGDVWLQNNISAYATWATTHNSLLIVTWDEDDGSQSNQVPTIFYGQPVKTGTYSESINHYSVLRTLEDMYGLPHMNNTASAATITDAWQYYSNSVSTTAAAQITLTQDADHQHVDWTMGMATGQLLINDASGLTINSNSGTDTLILSYGNGNPLPNQLNLNGTFTLVGLQGTNPLAGTSLDIGRSTVFISHSSSDPISAITNYLKNGYNNGAWNGAPTATTGVITSSAARTNPNHSTAIGFADSADGTGVNTSPNTIELRYTLIGDTNLDGAVNTTDLQMLLSNFNQSAKSWDQGDFNYDGKVNTVDLQPLLLNFNTSVGSQVLASAQISPPQAATVLQSATTTTRRAHSRH
jgi:hypothetical protein